MGGYFRVSKRPATAEELVAIARVDEIREELANAGKSLREAAGCSGGCAAIVASLIAIPIAVWVGIAQPQLWPAAAVGALVVVAVASLFAARSAEAAHARHLDDQRQELQKALAGELEPQDVEVIEARIDAALYLEYDSDDCCACLLVDLGEGQLRLLDLPQCFEWIDYEGVSPDETTLLNQRGEFERVLHREFRMVVGDETQILEYQPLSDEVIPSHNYDLEGAYQVAPEATEALVQTLFEVGGDWHRGESSGVFPGAMATWEADLRRAANTAGPHSLSRAEPHCDADRGLSRSREED